MSALAFDFGEVELQTPQLIKNLIISLRTITEIRHNVLRVTAKNIELLINLLSENVGATLGKFISGGQNGA